MSKKLKFDLMIEVPAGQITAGPPIATTLGPKGVPLGLLAKELNDRTSAFEKGARIRVRVKIFDDKSYDATIYGPTTRYLLFKAAGITKGASTTGNQVVGKITQAQLEEIALSQKEAYSTILGTAKSVGLQVQ